MPANTNPIFVLTPNVTWGTLQTANTAKDGTGTILTLFTAGANGGRVEKIRFSPLGANVNTVARIFLNNGSSNATPANNALIAEVTIPSSINSTDEANLSTEFVFVDGLVIPAGYKVNVTIHTAVASGISAVAEGGNF